ncbi:MAG TPA: hypothetical protein PLP29_13850 [Candidatus Ozemobacteraceae bacterium]|nr:hypothetical protein [Candidatus Ozemobacteraceae bacterium]
MPNNILKGILFRTGVITGMLVFLAALTLEAWPPDLQIVVTGNLAGHAAALTDRGELLSAPAWGVADLIRKLRREHGFATLVIGVGNDASIASPLSVAGAGCLERAWAAEAGIEFQALGPADLAVCAANPSLPADLFTRLWTNVTRADGEQAFPGWKRARLGNRSVTVACLISPSLLADIPLSRWQDLRVEDPLRALYRLRAQAPATDLKLLVCHLDTADTARIAKLARRDEVLLRVSQKTASSEQFAPSGPEIHDVPDGNRSLLVIRRFARLVGQTDVEVRRLPLAKLRETGSPPGPRLADAVRTVSARLFQPLRVLNTRELPDAPPYEVHLDTHARLAAAALRADAALITAPAQTAWLRDRIVTPAGVCNAFGNRRLRLYCLPGPVLHQLFFRLSHGSFSRRLGSYGLVLDLPGGAPRRLVVAGRPIEERKLYNVALDEGLFDDPTLRDLIGSDDLPGSRGITLWNAWLDALPGLPRLPVPAQ